MEDKRLRVKTMYVDAARRNKLILGREYPVYCILGCMSDNAVCFGIKNEEDKNVWMLSSECMPIIEFDIEGFRNNEESFEGELY